jgi:hypothetical protein
VSLLEFATLAHPLYSETMRWVAIIPAVLAIACGGTKSSGDGDPAPQAAESAKDAARAPPDVPEGFVVLGAYAPLHVRPSADAPSFAFEPDVPDGYAAFAVVGNQGDWIQIRNLDAEEAAKHCVGGWNALEDFALDFWVRTSDVQRVTVRSVVDKFGDGTSAMLAAGTPVKESGALWTALGPGASAQVPLRVDAVGRFYRPGALYDPPKLLGAMANEAPLEIGGHAIDTNVLLGEDAIDLFESTRRDDGTLVGVGTRCVELKALLRGNAPDQFPVEPTLAPSDAKGIDEGEGLEFAAGTKVFWYEGDAAGKVVAPHRFIGYARVDSDRRCFDHAGVQVCLRAEDGTRTGGGS